ncbi:MAG: LysM peptidoglycan-binding domain-containing protein [Anaerolineae bacterium]|nr:LysM peptidoglycan-binding domain-containing protein [Anaerolineae bacterium]
MRLLSKRNRCPQCGARLHRGASLCPECAHRLSTRRVSEHCASCGARLSAEAEACPICGAARMASDGVLGPRALLAVAIVVLIGALGGMGWWLRPWERVEVNLDALALEPTATATASPYPTWTTSPTPPPTKTATATLVPTLTPTSTLEPTSTASPTPGMVRYTVVEGDTPLGIAVKFDVDLAQLLSLNGLNERSILQIGQELVIRGPSGGPNGEELPEQLAEDQPSEASADLPRLASSSGAKAPPTAEPPIAKPQVPTQMPSPTPEPPTATPGMLVHVVQSGDMLLSLAQRYDVSSEAIAEANGISLNSILSVGQELIIPGLATTPAPTATPEASDTPTLTLTPSPTMPPQRSLPQFPYAAPLPLGPVDGARISGVDTPVMLNWTSVGILAEDEWYEIELWAPGTDESVLAWSKATSWRLEPMRSGDDESAAPFYRWQVRVSVRGENGQRAAVLSPSSSLQSFIWQ